MKMLRGIPASPGIASSFAQTIRPVPPVNILEQRTVEASAETTRFEKAIGQAIARLDKLLSAAHGPVAAMLGAQQEMLDDPELKQGVDALITSGFSSEAAVMRVTDEYAEQLASLPDAYLAARAEDVREVGRRIVSELRGISLEVHLDRAAILVARDLSPADIIGVDLALLQAIVTETGSATGHLAIVAQGLGIPAVVGIAGALDEIRDRTPLIVDGEKGEVTVSPDEESRRAIETRLKVAQHERQGLEVYRDRPGRTADGVHVEVFANIGSLAEAHKAVEMGAEGVGLFRTELLAAQGLPSEEEQHAIYQEVAAVLRRPLIVRTFDIGGDKPVPGLDMPAEANPFLGWRGIRVALDRPEEVFLPQVRAILRVAANYDLRMMLPMVATPEEVAAARALIAQSVHDLERAGYATRHIPIGIMVETPAAALTLDHFRGLIDFASIGTNDLVQYTYAVDRTNAQVRERAKPSGAATLRLVAQVCRASMPVAICGQLASDADAIPLLVGLGVRELSVAPARIPAIKKLLSTLMLPEMQTRAKRAVEEVV